MLTQKVQNPRLKALPGIALVLGIAAAAVAGSALFTALIPRLGSAASALFIVYGMAIAWFLLNRFVLAFSYAASDDVLRVSRVYGRYERFMEDVWLNRVRAMGEEAELKKRFPSAHVSRATRPGCPLPPLALAYDTADKTAILVIQPDDALREHLIRKCKKK